MKQSLATIAASAALSFAANSAQAALVDRGGGMLYDDVLNVTWLQDANFARTSGYDADGRMDWTAANTWAANLFYGGYDDWRLAGTAPVNGSTWNLRFSTAGTTDYGFNITSPNAELSHMYYVNLGLKGYWSTTGSYQADFGIFGNGVEGGQKDVGLVKNLQSSYYWTETPYPGNPGTTAMYFSMSRGEQAGALHANNFFAWAVRDGDVAAGNEVPEPGSVTMLLASLGLLAAARRRQRSRD